MTRIAPDSAREARLIERMASSYGMLQPTDAELAAKRREALPKALLGRSTKGRGLMLGLAAALLAGGVLASAGGWLSAERKLSPLPAEPSSVARRPMPPQRPMPPERAMDSDASPQARSAPQPESAAADGLPKSDEQRGSQPARPLEAAPQRTPAPSPREGADGWSTVAEALREKDTVRARKALSALSRSSEPSTRDAADLARAQLDVAGGDVASARSVFERVSRDGATPQLRSQAERALRQLEAK